MSFERKWITMQTECNVSPFLCGSLQCSCYCAIASLSCVSGTLYNHQPCKEFIISWTAGNIRHTLMSGLIRLNLYREISYYLLKKNADRKTWRSMEILPCTRRQRNRKNLHCTTFLRAVQWKDSNKKASEIHFCLAKMNITKLTIRTSYQFASSPSH